jgi:intein/homing endonuclease
MSIKHGNGRYRSERDQTESEKLLQSELARLNPDEREALRVILKEMEEAQAGKIGGVLKSIQSAELKSEPVDLKTFIYDPHYLGNTCDVLYPKLLEDITELFEGGYSEAVYTGCIDLDAKVQLADGERASIRTLLKRGTDAPEVLGAPDGKLGHTAASNVVHSGVKNVVRIELANGLDLRLTPEHKVMTQRGWVPAIALTAADSCLLPRIITTKPSASVTPDEAKLIGYMIGDGCSDPTRARFVDGRKGTVDDFVATLRKCGFEAKSVLPKNGAYEVCVKNAKTSGFLDLLDKHGIFNVGSLTRQASPLVCRSPLPSVAAFLNGLFACEGTIYDSPKSPPRVQIGLNNRELILDIHALLLRFGINARISKKESFHKQQQKTYSWWILALSNKRDIEVFLREIGTLPGKEEECRSILARLQSRESNTNVDCAPLNWAEAGRILREHGVVRPRGSKWLRWNDSRADRLCSYDSLVEFCETHPDSGAARVLKERFIEPGLRYEKVTAVVPEEAPIEVGDVSVPKNNSFFAASIYVHNSIGWGKTFLASIGICYILYQLSLMKNPQRSFGIAAGSYIDIVVFSVTEELAKKVAFDNIVGKIQASPYFQENFPFEVTKRELRFPNQIRVAPRATTDNSALGLNVMSALMDETDFMANNMKSKKIAQFATVDKAESIYNTIKRRMKSRFERQGKLPGIMFIVSSKNTRDNFTERLIQRSKNESTFFVRDYATWHVKPENYFNSGRFWVLVGNEQIPTRILTPEELEKYKDNIPDNCVLIDIPEDFRREFENDLEGSVRDVAGIATVSVSPFIQRRDKITECLALYKQVYPQGGHPFTVEEFEPGKQGQMMWNRITEYVNERTFLGMERRLRPKVNPKAVRHVHIDPSLSGDATGFCMAHVSGYKEVIRTAGDGTEYRERAPVYTVDLILRVIPPIGDEIVMGDMRQFIYDFTAHGYIVSTVTMDSWQSADAIQQLSQKGYTSEVLSVDVKMDPYENLKLALYEGRVLMYEYQPLLDELYTIQKDLVRRKVDHPPNKSKDCSDALAGCLFSLSANAYSQPLPFVRAEAGAEESMWSGLPTEHVQRPGNQNRTPMWQDMVPPFLVGGNSGGWGNSGDE